MEGTIELIMSVLQESLSNNIDKESIYDNKNSALKILQDSIDPRKYNGALLVGLNGVVVKSHGSTDSFGFYNAIMTAIEEIKKEIIPNMIATFKE
jgi:glycerol-3-phosphate acyltransferase PlsX